MKTDESNFHKQKCSAFLFLCVKTTIKEHNLQHCTVRVWLRSLSELSRPGWLRTQRTYPAGSEYGVISGTPWWSRGSGKHTQGGLTLDLLLCCWRMVELHFSHWCGYSRDRCHRDWQAVRGLGWMVMMERFPRGWRRGLDMVLSVWTSPVS